MIELLAIIGFLATSGSMVWAINFWISWKYTPWHMEKPEMDENFWNGVALGWLGAAGLGALLYEALK